jgi:hypothetical protein
LQKKLSSLKPKELVSNQFTYTYSFFEICCAAPNIGFILAYSITSAILIS